MKKCGMTLIELLVVIAVIGILAGLVLPVLGSGRRSALSAKCVSNLHQIGLALELYVQDNNHYLPICAGLPSASPGLPPITAVLAPYARNRAIFWCPADQTEFTMEQTSYEWNLLLNGAPYDRPEDLSPATQVLVEIVFGGRANTPLVGDMEPFHRGVGIGKNALFFDGRVDQPR